VRNMTTVKFDFEKIYSCVVVILVVLRKGSAFPN